MTYMVLNVSVLVIVALISIVLTLLTAKPHRVSLRALAMAMLSLLVMTAVFDNVMIGVGLVAYSPEHISGIMLGLAPIEDFAYAVAASLLMPTLWAFVASVTKTRATE